MIHRKPLTTG